LTHRIFLFELLCLPPDHHPSNQQKRWREINWNLEGENMRIFWGHFLPSPLVMVISYLTVASFLSFSLLLKFV
jgi:hypothetical protein